LTAAPANATVDVTLAVSGAVSSEPSLTADSTPTQ
jgi:hypothetical protein